MNALPADSYGVCSDLIRRSVGLYLFTTCFCPDKRVQVLLYDRVRYAYQVGSALGTGRVCFHEPKTAIEELIRQYVDREQPASRWGLLFLRVWSWKIQREN